jgi:F-type H+-transporting ATPase subunit delta
MSIAVANQYAKALLDVVLKDGSGTPASGVLAQLESFRDALATSAELREVLMTPAIAPKAKRKALDRIADLLGLSPVVINFLNLVKDRRRVPLMDDICIAFREQMDAHLGILRARVASARELNADQRQALIDRLRSATGKSVDVDYSVDPELVGGAKVTIGSTIYDGSVRGRLEGLRLRLTSEG